jgi:hypothetical protein
MKENNQEDKMLERLLAGLGAAPVEEGFAQRVTRGVEARTKAVEARPMRWRGTMLGFASAAAALLLCAVALQEARHRDVAVPSARNAPRVMPGAAPPRMAPIAGEAAAVGPPAPRRMIRLPHKVPATDERTVTAALVSFPAPEAPLTQQERLLLRIVHRGDPVEVAMLSPQESAREEAAEAAEFQRFFPPKAPAPNVVPEDLTKEKGDTP